MVLPLGEVDAEVTGRPETQGAADSNEKAIEGRSPWQIARGRFRRDKVSMVAMIIVALAVVIAILAPILQKAGVLDPYAPNYELVTGLGSTPTGGFGGASWSHPLGVEPGIGRDVLSRILVAITYSLIVAASATAVSVILGAILGIISGYMGKRTDFFISRFMDLVLSFPQLVMLLALSSVVKDRITALGVPAGTPTSIVYLILVLGFFGWPYFARIVRGQVLSLREREFVEAARSLGAKRRYIWRKELLPNLWAPLLVFATLNLPANISAEAALSYLGVGIQSPTPSLGNILNTSTPYLETDPTFFFAPGVVLTIIVLSFNLFGDGLRDALDPKSTR